jgi:hypothetical protein
MRYTTFTLARSLFAVLLLWACCCVVLAADPMPNDYLVFDKGYPKSVAVVPFQQLYRITSAGITNTTKYKNIKLADPVAFQTIYQVDKDGKEIEGTKKTFENSKPKDTSVNIAKGTWVISGGTLLGGANFMPGLPPGKYRVIVSTKVDPDPTDPKVPRVEAVLVETIDVP